MNATRLSLLLAGTLAAGLGLGAGGVYLLGPGASSPSPANSLVPPPEAVPVAPAAPPVGAVPGQGAETKQGQGTKRADLPAVPDDAARALEGVRQGDFVSLATISETVRARFPGQILGAKLSEDDGVTFYEIKLLTEKGHLLEVEVDPRTGQITGVEEEDD